MTDKKGIYLIPDRNHLSDSERLREKYNACYEYNDFYTPKVLDDRKLQEEIIETYLAVRTDFSGDTIHGAFLDVTIHSMDPFIREASEKRMRQSMDIAKRMGARGVVFHTNRLYGFREQSYLTNWEKTNELFFTKLAEEYPEQEILIENMFDEAYDALLGLARRLKEISNVGICLDYAHAAAFGEKPGEWLTALAPYVKHFHLNDNNLKEDQHLPVGAGSIDWTEFESIRTACNVEASALIEVKGSERQEASLNYMKQNGVYIRK